MCRVRPKLNKGEEREGEGTVPSQWREAPQETMQCKSPAAQKQKTHRCRWVQISRAEKRAK
jgi:hypothetical protein